MALKTIASFALNPAWRYGGSTAKLRLYYSESFVDNESRAVVGGAVGSPGFYEEVNITIAGNVATVAAFDLITTEDSDNPNVKVVGVLYDEGGAIRDVLFDWSVPSNGTVASPSTFALMEAYNDRNHIINPPAFYLTQAQILAFLNAALAAVGIVPATNLIAGIVKLSVAAADPANPIVWGTNDPLVRDALKLMGVILDPLMSAPADGNTIGYDAASTSWKPQATAVPSFHASSHENGGTDEISVAGLSGLLADAQTALAHAASHENGGADEISVTGLSGLLADPQTPIIADDSITNDKLAEVSTATFKGRTTAGTGNPEDLTATQATALLDAMVGDSGAGGTKGLAPAPAAGDAAAGKFLKADGTYAAPSGTGAPASATYITQTPDGGLSNEQALSALATGLVKNTTTTGVLSIGAAGTDYVAPGGALGTPSSGTLSGCTVDGTNLVGFRNIPQNSQSADYTTDADDAGGHVYHPVADDNPRTFTIDSNANVAYPIGTAITFINDQNTLTIAITDDTLVWAEDGSTGPRSLAENGMATAIKVTSTRWIISGTGLT